jgi:hypothetical protein
VSIDPTFLRAVFGLGDGYAHIAVGRGAMLDEKGSYRHQNWEQTPFRWPHDAGWAVEYMDEVLAQPGRNDIYVCPNILKTQKRVMGTAVSHALLHADADHGIDLSRVLALRGFAVASGSPGHGQVYVPSARDVPLSQYEALQRGMRSFFNGDNKIADNDLLRPVGSFNQKAVVLHGGDEPYPVEWIIKPSQVPMKPDDIARLLGIEGLYSDEVVSQNGSTTSPEPSRRIGEQHAEEAFDLERYPAVRTSIEHETGDRSADTHTIVAAGFREGLQISQIRWAVNQRLDLRTRLDGRDDDDIARIFCKLADDEQSKKGPQATSFDYKVTVECEKLRVREAARKLFESEKQSGIEAFDADLLCNVLIRPAEEPYRIVGLLPSEAGMLIVAQRKVGKTTVVLNIVRCVITGELFLARFPVRPITGRVAILNFEVSAAQLATWAQEVDVPSDRLFLVNIRGRRNPLTHSDDRARLAALLRDQQVELLVIDPFGRACGATNQNDPGEVSTWLVDLDRFVRAEVGATDLILTAHAGWNAERARGASALEDWADSIVTVTRDEQDEARYLRATGRDVQVDEDRLRYDSTTRLLSLTDSGSRKQNQRVAKSEALVGHIVEHVGRHAGASASDIIRGLREDPAIDLPFQDNDVREACRLAEKQGKVRRQPEGPGKPTRHFLVGDGLGWPPAGTLASPDGEHSVMTPSNPVQTTTWTSSQHPVQPRI